MRRASWYCQFFPAGRFPLFCMLPLLLSWKRRRMQEPQRAANPEVTRQIREHTSADRADRLRIIPMLQGARVKADAGRTVAEGNCPLAMQMRSAREWRGGVFGRKT